MSRQIEVYTAHGTDKDTWAGLVCGLPEGTRDVYFTPEYALIYELTFGEPAYLFVYGDKENYLLYVFLKRSVSDLPFCREQMPGENICDVISPYGYGGPIVGARTQAKKEELVQGFLDEFHGYCLENNIVAEFVRLHPLLRNHELLRSQIPVEQRSTTVWINLTKGQEAIWKNMRKGHKSSIKKSMREQVVVTKSRREEDLQRFYEWYIDTMRRNKASQDVFFSKEFFDRTIKLLGDQATLVRAEWRGQTIAVSLFMHNWDYMHYHFSAAEPEYLPLCANHLIIHEMIIWALRHGYKFFHLGGSPKVQDGIFRFKKGFSSDTAAFYTYSRIHNQKLYKELCEMKRRFDEERGMARRDSRSGYFPAYRN